MIFLNSNLMAQPSIVASEKQWLFGSEGQKYFDTWLGSGTLILGHHKPTTVDVSQMLPFGQTLDPQFMQLICGLVDFEIGAIGFQTSGSSAVGRAVRLARSITGKEKIAVFSSFWHGSENEFLFKNNKELFSAGVPNSHLSAVSWFPSLDEFLAEPTRETFGAILIEPHQGANPSMCMLQLTADQRQELKEMNVLLICDEIITGFREIYGSSRAGRSVDPDIVIFGKSVALGFPVGLVVVNASIINGNAKLPFWGGTFAASPMQLSRIRHALGELKGLDYDIIYNNHKYIVRYLNKLVGKYDLSVKSGCAFSRILNTRDLGGARAFLDYSEKFELLREEMLDRGVFVGSNALVFPSVFSISEQ